MKRFFLFLFIIFTLSLLQFNILPALFPFAYIPNILIIFALIFALFERPDKDFAFLIAFLAGLFNDLISPVFGFYIIITFGVVYILKLLLNKYVQLSFLR
jgi:hypothetical protein